MNVTPRQLECVRAHVSEGSYKAAAHRLGLSPSTLCTHLAVARRRVGVKTAGQLIYVLTARGELVVPDWRGG